MGPRRLLRSSGNFVSSGFLGFTSAYGTNQMAANTSQTLYQTSGSQRGLIFVVY
jgi:hypothetical protein